MYVSPETAHPLSVPGQEERKQQRVLSSSGKSGVLPGELI